MRSNQSFLQEISPEYSLWSLMLKLQNFSHLMRRADSLEKTLILRKIEGRRRKGWQKMRWLDGFTDSMKMISIKMVKDREPRCASVMGSQTVGHNWMTEEQQQKYWCVHITQPNLQIQFDFYEHFNGIFQQKWEKQLLKAFWITEVFRWLKQFWVRRHCEKHCTSWFLTVLQSCSN